MANEKRLVRKEEFDPIALDVASNNSIIMSNENKTISFDKNIVIDNIIPSKYIASDGTLADNASYSVKVYAFVDFLDSVQLISDLIGNDIAQWAIYEDAECTILKSIGDIHTSGLAKYTKKIVVKENCFIGVTQVVFF